MARRAEFGKLNVGDRLFEVQYYEVVEIDREKREAVLRNERGYELEVTHDVIEEGMYTANQYNSEERLPRTQIVEILENAKDTIFTVNFHKQPKEKEVLEEALAVIRAEGTGDPKVFEKHLGEAIKRGIHGEERTLVGYLIQTEPKMGRSQVIDLEAPTAAQRIRLIDHRTINWIVIKNVKYIVK
ncbi:hypothetical protein L6R29_24525 [Myxococcota bacterium]|nr:hypothetical protein [Myxococcota bacterium]